MFNRIALVAALLLAAGCSQNWDGRGTSTAAADAAGAATVASSADAQARVLSGRGFAAMPDNGDLVAYPAQKIMRKQGAFTWHQVGLSEEHALRAITNGEMVITAPNGAPIRLQYERHVEHPDGNWTWIGRDAHGADAVVTFGDKAAFGTIPFGDEEPLRLTVAGGTSWLVATDRRQRGAVDGLQRRNGTDYVVPPELVSAAADQRVASSAMQAESAESTGTPTVDVALGYTSGFASALGGASQAVTRLNNMVEITNTAFANSQMGARIRLVHTVQVNYPDATRNEDTLHRLTGYGNGVSQPDPAFAALRAARDQYGADLVSVVRKFYTPENDGCGIAWLIGGNQQSIDASDAPFGYSVVSDGTDLDETDGKTYGCRQETLAHELGHNMGQAHNTEDTSSPGAHSFAYGYREPSTTGFYTVMAYRLADSQQTSIRHFANPNVTVNGRPTGTASADNARSLNLTMPIVAGFRATVVVQPPPTQPPGGSTPGKRGDIDGDGKADVLWFNEGSGELYYWLMNGTTVRSGKGGVFAPNNATPRRQGDFNRDGRLDVVFATGGDIWIYFGNSTGGFTSHYVAPYPAGWNLAGVADMDADGMSDFLWYHPATGQLYGWLMDSGTIRLGRAYPPAPANATPRAVADFNKDGRGDVVLASAGDIWIYLGTSTGSFVSTYVAMYPPGWNFVGAGDVDADGGNDFLWHHPVTGELYYWLIDNGGIRLGRSAGIIPPTLVPRAVADYNGDGRADVLMHNGVDIHMYLGNTSGGFTGTYLRSYPAGWQLQAP